MQGMGWVTTEELVFDAKGRLTTHAPATYKIPVASDMPERFNTRLHMRPNETDSIYRSKAVGEPPFMLGIAVYSRDPRRGARGEARRPAEAGGALHAGGDLERGEVAGRLTLLPLREKVGRSAG